MKPILRAEDQPEGAGILDEIPNALGLLVWGAFRDVMFWIESPRHRARLFADDAHTVRLAALRGAKEGSAIWVPLLTLAGITNPRQTVLSCEVGQACRIIAAWAQERGAPQTRLAFAQAAVLLEPHKLDGALDVARGARDLGDLARAESWFRWVVVQARRAQAWESYGWAFIGLGTLYRRTGNAPAARTVLERALRSGFRHRQPVVQASAHHYLFVLAAEANKYLPAYEHAAAALRAYGLDATGIVKLASDVGRFWLEQGDAEHALPLFEEARRRVRDPVLEAISAGNIAWAAAMIGNIGKYRHATADATRLLENSRVVDRKAEGWLLIANAALVAKEWAVAESAAGTALSIAEAIGEAEIAFLAQDQLHSARAQRQRALERPTVAFAYLRRAERLSIEMLSTMSELDLVTA